MLPRRVAGRAWFLPHACSRHIYKLRLLCLSCPSARSMACKALRDLKLVTSCTQPGQGAAYFWRLAAGPAAAAAVERLLAGARMAAALRDGGDAAQQGSEGEEEEGSSREEGSEEEGISGDEGSGDEGNGAAAGEPPGTSLDSLGWPLPQPRGQRWPERTQRWMAAVLHALLVGWSWLAWSLLPHAWAAHPCRAALSLGPAVGARASASLATAPFSRPVTPQAASDSLGTDRLMEAAAPLAGERQPNALRGDHPYMCVLWVVQLACLLLPWLRTCCLPSHWLERRLPSCAQHGTHGAARSEAGRT